MGPTVIYTFMQVAGLTNDHLIGCYRFDECAAAAMPESNEAGSKDNNFKEEMKRDGKNELVVGDISLELSRAVEGLSVSSS